MHHNPVSHHSNSDLCMTSPTPTNLQNLPRLSYTSSTSSHTTNAQRTDPSTNPSIIHHPHSIHTPP